MWPTAKKSKNPSLLFLCGFILEGCVATTTDIDRLQGSLNQVQKSQADLIVKIDELDRSIGILSESLSNNQKSMSSLSVKLEDTQAGLGQRMELISRLLSDATQQAKVAIPGDLYRTAYGDYLSGKFSLALLGFTAYLASYPNSDLTDDAQFYLADCYLKKKDYKTARIEFDKLLSISKEFRASALLHRAYALQGMNLTNDKKLTLETLLKEFPNSPESKVAKEMIQADLPAPLVPPLKKTLKK